MRHARSMRTFLWMLLSNFSRCGGKTRWRKEVKCGFDVFGLPSEIDFWHGASVLPNFSVDKTMLNMFLEFRVLFQ